MNLEYLAEFKAIIQWGSFTKAAYELNMSQSTLSKHIAALEKELDVLLFNRSTSGLALTSAGEKVLYTSNEIEDLMQELNVSLQEVRRRSHVKLFIGSQTSLNHCGVAPAIWAFRELHPDIDVIADDTMVGKLNPLAYTEIELAFSRWIPEGDRKYEYTLFAPDNLCAIIPVCHPLAAQESVTWDQLRDEKILLASPNISEIYIKAAKSCGYLPNLRQYENMRIGSMYEYVRFGMGLTLSGRMIYGNFKTPGTIAIDIIPRVSRDFFLVRRKHQPLSRSAKLFWRFIQESYTKRGQRPEAL